MPLAALSVLLGAWGAPKQALAQLPGYTGGYPTLQSLYKNAEALAASPLLERLPYGTSQNGQPLVAYRLADSPTPGLLPAVVVLGGLDGREAYTSHLCLGLMQQVLQAHTQGVDSVRKLLKTTALVFIPVAFPDGAVWGQKGMIYETDGNTQPHDDDNDARTDEDGPDDLNNDGLITLYYYQDPAGEYLPHPLEPRLFVKADVSKGQKGQYSLLTEGIDNDKDKRWNEDGTGGTAFNRNFTYQYPWFKAGSGKGPLTEPSARQLVEFLFAQKTVHTVWVLGPQDNLLKPWEHDAKAEPKTGLVGKTDAECLKRLSDNYLKLTYPKNKSVKTVADASTGGSLLHWAYQHYGRFAVGGPGWYAPTAAPTMADTAAKARLDKRLNHDLADIRRLAYLDLAGQTDCYVFTQPIKHPDFHDRVGGVGGLKPFAGLAPPYPALKDSLLPRSTQWLLHLGNQLPQLTVAEFQAEPLGSDIFRVCLRIANTGGLPTHTEVGKNLMALQELVAELSLAKGQKLLSGYQRTKFGHLAPGASYQTTFIVQGKGALGLKAGAPHVGSVSGSVELK